MKIGASWRSTVSACVSAAGMFVIFASAPPYSVHFPVAISALAGFMALGGLASLGINAKDSGVTGGTIVQPGIPVAPAAEVMVAEPPKPNLPTGAWLTPDQNAPKTLRKW